MGMPPRQAFAQHMPMAPKAMIRLLFRYAAARRFSVRSVVEDSCFGYARFHFIQYNPHAAIFIPRFFEKAGKSTSPDPGRTIKGDFLGI
jgi:hypothetical protein